MPRASQDQSRDGNPTAAEIFRVFRNSTVASIKGLTLLLGECADLRADLVTVHSLHSDGDGVFLAHQQDRILELKKAAMAMETLIDALSRGTGDAAVDADNGE